MPLFFLFFFFGAGITAGVACALVSEPVESDPSVLLILTEITSLL